MSYEQTEVSVSRSQEGIRKLILGNGGTGVAFISQPPKEGFEAQVPIDGKVYHIRIVAECVPKERKRKRRWRYGSRPQRDPMEAEARRVWRVLFYNLKSTFESANSHVMELTGTAPFVHRHEGREDHRGTYPPETCRGDFRQSRPAAHERD